MRVLALALAALMVAATLAGVAFALQRNTPTASADTCAFPFTPTTYEGLKDRQTFLTAIEPLSPSISSRVANAPSTMPWSSAIETLMVLRPVFVAGVNGSHSP